MRLAVLVGLVAAAVACGCQPTGVPVCDRNVAALVLVDQEGYRYDCTPGFPSTHAGWADHNTKTLWIWPEMLDDPAYVGDEVFVTKVMWHELGHAVWENDGRSGTQTQEETWADGYAYCHMTVADRAGMSFKTKPANCITYQ